MIRGRSFYPRNVKDKINYDENLDCSVFLELSDNCCDSDEEMDIISDDGKEETTQDPDISEADSEVQEAGKVEERVTDKEKLSTPEQEMSVNETKTNNIKIPSQFKRLEVILTPLRRDSVCEEDRSILELWVDRCDLDEGDIVKLEKETETLDTSEQKMSLINTYTETNNIKIPSRYNGLEVILTPPKRDDSVSLEPGDEEDGFFPEDLVDSFCDVDEKETASEISGQFPEKTSDLGVSEADFKELEPGEVFDTNTMKGNAHEEPLLSSEVEEILINDNAAKHNIMIQPESTGFEIILTPKNPGLVEKNPGSGKTTDSKMRKSDSKFKNYSEGKAVEKISSPDDCPLLKKNAKTINTLPGMRVPELKAYNLLTRSTSPLPTNILPTASRVKKSDCYKVRKPVQKGSSPIKISSLSSGWLGAQEFKSNKPLVRYSTLLPTKIVPATSILRKSLIELVQTSSSASLGISEIQELKSNKLLVRSTSLLPTEILPASEDNTFENTCKIGVDSKGKVVKDLIRKLNRKERENRRLKKLIEESKRILEQAHENNEDKTVMYDVIDVD